MPYGIANTTGRPDFDAALEIVDAAYGGGVRIFDTAAAYGESEAVLGRCLAELGLSGKVAIHTKFPPGTDPKDSGALLDAARQSADRLGVDALAGILFHGDKALDTWGPEADNGVQALLESGLAASAGISCYRAEVALRAASTIALQVLQVPLNILDRRFAPACAKALANSVTLMLRSVFLQGLLLMTPDALPGRMAFAAPVLGKVRALAARYSLSVRAMALSHARESYPGALTVFGAETPGQVRQNLAAWDTPPVPGLAEAIRKAFPGMEEKLVNPTLWEAR
jgi:aryl-alcohol dehydrogenase-like predicted oxidoreductase